MVYCITYDKKLLSFERKNQGERWKMSNILKARDEEHSELQFSSFSNSMALELGLRLVEKARLKEQVVTVDIRKHGQQIFHYALEGTSADNDSLDNPEKQGCRPLR